MMMITGSNYIGQKPSAKGTNHLKAFNPSDNSLFPEEFKEATSEEIDEAVQLASKAAKQLKNFSSAFIADFLDAIAEEILNLGDHLVQRASQESGLPEGRITGERGRTCGQLNAFARLLREGSWVDAIIDTAQPDRAPIPKPDLRKMLIPIGPVVVFGASNFPLAFSTAGGDTASALAAGNPVIVKGHESHLGTNELVSQAILKAAQRTGMPDGIFSMVNGGIDVGQQLVKYPAVKAVGFTGSLRGGRALFDAVNQRPEPIPVYAEMGSVNPVLILPEKLQSDPKGMAQAIASSVTLGVGQFCTNPGLLFGIKSDELETFKTELEKTLAETPSATMLNAKIAATYDRQAKEVISSLNSSDPGDTPENNQARALTASVSGEDFLKNPQLAEEVFGPFTLLAECDSPEQMQQAIENLHGQLTGTVQGTANDLEEFKEVVNSLREKVGRILFGGVPTGVEVCHAMHHGGPYPASTDAKFTSVGSDAIYRFVRPVSYQNWPQEHLPDALKNENPLNIWRTVDGEKSKASIES